VGSNTCEQACQHRIDCGEKPSSSYASCVTDCQTTSWPANYITCRATTCGLTEAQCDNF
jgi:hypothetical protein